MENIPEIDLKMEIVKVGEYNIDDMIKMFGDRLKNAIYVDENQKPVGLIMKKMAKKCKKWKYWNADIRKAYRKYYGLLLAPYIIVQGEPIICYSADIDGAAISKMLSKEISSRYKLTEINPDLNEKEKNCN